MSVLDDIRTDQAEGHLPSGGHHTLTLYNVAWNGSEFVALGPNGPGFSATCISQMKYGSRSIISHHGHQVAKLLVPHLRPILADGDQIVVTGTPMVNVPNVARLLAIDVECELREGGFDTQLVMIGQESLPQGDYGHLTPAERAIRNASKKYIFDPAAFTGKHVVVIDDVHNTGSIARSVLSILAKIPGILSVTLVHVVMLEQKTTEINGIEYKLNHVAMQSLDDLRNLMNSGDFVMSTRAIRFILDFPVDDVKCFMRMRAIGANRICEIYNAAIADGYDQMPLVAETFKVIKRRYWLARIIAALQPH
jgi:nitrate reductase NapAB chaperone NapD